MSNKLVLGYYGIRGRANPIRFLLEYTEVPYEEKIYQGPDWFAEKPALVAQNPYANLPYLKDGETYYYESQALAFVVVKKSGKLGLLGKDPDVQIAMAQTSGVLKDLQGAFFQNVMGTTKEGLAQNKKEIWEKLKVFLKKLETHVQGKKYSCSNEPTVPDFFLLETLDISERFQQNAFEDLPNLKQLHKNLNDLPQIKAYKASDRFKGNLFFPPNMPWSGLDE